MSKYSFTNYYLSLILLILISNNMAIANSSEKQNLLLISSYHPNFPTFFQQIDGLRSELPPEKYNLDVEFMDSKRFPDTNTKNNFFQYLRNKIKKLPQYNLIFTSDDNALNFIIKHHNELFENIPIVFLGVNNLENAELQNQNKLITGIVEVASIIETINLAKDIIPDLTNIIAISDGTPSGTADLKSFLSIRKQFSHLNLSYFSLTELSWEELASKIKNLNSQSCIILLSAYRDKFNKSKFFPQSLDLIISNSPVPVFHLWEHGLGDGIIGGQVISHFQQGKQAGIMAKKILSGINISNLKVETKSPNISVLDYNVLKKFELSDDKLPANIMYINKPISTFQKNKKAIYLISLIIIFLSISIFVLIFNIQRRKAEEKKSRKSEKVFRALFNQSSHFIGILTLNGKLYRANTPALDAVGLKESDVYGQYFWETPWWVNTGYEEKLKEALKKAATGEVVRFIATHNFYDGKEIIVNFSAKPIYDDNNQVTDILVEGLDITKFRRIEERLKHVEKMESVGILAGGVAHDFNNMLGGIIGCAESLQKLIQHNPDAEKFLNMIIESSEKAAKLIKNLLAFSRKQQIFFTAIDVHKVIEDSVMLLTHTVDKRIQIVSKLYAETSSISGDQSQLQNIFLNLGINASHAMTGGGRLTFSTKIIQFDATYCSTSPFKLVPGDYLQIDVSDNGSGISEENLKHIFDPFFTTKEQGKGTGLGLSAVYGTVIQHMGAITVHSELGFGTVFNIYLPLSKQEKTEDFTSILQSATQEGSILMVDDDKIMRLTAKKILESLGCTVTLATNGQEALELFSKAPDKFDLVILDMVMPKINGYDCFKEITRIRPNICIILSSGYTSDTFIEDMKQHGLYGYITKPYRAKDLCNLVCKALESINKKISISEY